MTFLRRELPQAITFLYMPDEPRAPAYPRILTLADNIHSNPGPGRALPIFVTSTYVEPLDAAIDIWCAGPQGFDTRSRASGARARPRYWSYNGGRPAGGAITIDAPATDARATIWAAFKHDVASTSTGTACTGGTTRRNRGAQPERLGQPASPSTTAGSRTSR